MVFGFGELGNWRDDLKTSLLEEISEEDIGRRSMFLAPVRNQFSGPVQVNRRNVTRSILKFASTKPWVPDDDRSGSDDSSSTTYPRRRGRRSPASLATLWRSARSLFVSFYSAALGGWWGPARPAAGGNASTADGGLLSYQPIELVEVCASDGQRHDHRNTTPIALFLHVCQQSCAHGRAPPIQGLRTIQALSASWGSPGADPPVYGRAWDRLQSPTSPASASASASAGDRSAQETPPSAGHKPRSHRSTFFHPTDEPAPPHRAAAHSHSHSHHRHRHRHHHSECLALRDLRCLVGPVGGGGAGGRAAPGGEAVLLAREGAVVVGLEPGRLLLTREAAFVAQVRPASRPISLTPSSIPPQLSL
jgi:hypothetical protein